MGIIVAIVAVGGLAVFSIYLQQDKAIVEFSKATNPNYHCLEDYEYIRSMPKGTSEFTKNIDEIQAASKKFYGRDGCANSFEKWMPDTHPAWNEMVGRENSIINNCGKYLRGEIEMSELDKELFEGWNCERFS